MAPPYTSYADLAAEQVEGVDYTRTAVVPAGAFLSAIAIHGGGIEAGSGELARYVAGDRMAFYEFAGIKASGNSDLHITATLFDEPLCLDLQAKVYRTISFHGFAGAPGVPVTIVGGLDGRLRELIRAELVATGFAVGDAVAEIAGTDPANICNRNAGGAGVQLELSRALRESFFPGGDLSRAMRESGQRTPTFYAYAQAVLRAVTVALSYDGQLSRVQLVSVAPGLRDDFDRDPWDGPAQNINPSFESGTAGWLGQNATIAQSADHATDGTHSLRVTPNGTSASGGVMSASSAKVPVTPGQTVLISCFFYSPGGWDDLRPCIDWHDAAGAYLSTDLGDDYQIPPGEWTYTENEFEVPAGAAYAVLRARHGGTPSAADIYYVDELELIIAETGWRTSTSGHTYLHVGGSDDDYEVFDGIGYQKVNNPNVSRWSLAAVRQLDFDVTASVAFGEPAQGGSVFMAVGGRLSDDAQTGYLARVEFTTTQTVNLTVRKRLAGSETLLGTTFNTGMPHVFDQLYRVRLQGVGGTLRAKCWMADEPEPDNWQIVQVDPDPIDTPGRIGFRSILSINSTNVFPVWTEWSDVVTRGVALVERSANGITWQTVRGGADLDGTAGAQVELDDYEFTDSVANHYRVRVVEADSGATLFVDGDQITPQLDTVWLKSLARPFLNRPVTVVDWSDVTRASRSGVFQIVGRSRPVVVTDLHGPRQWTLDVAAHTEADAQNLDLLISTGEVQFVHVPAGSRIPGGYVALGETSERRPQPRSQRRIFSLALTECVPPGPDVVPAIGTWTTVVNTYATWADVLAAHPTWGDLMQLVGSPEDVIVP